MEDINHIKVVLVEKKTHQLNGWPNNLELIHQPFQNSVPTLLNQTLIACSKFQIYLGLI